jgi:hypothetical protein
MSIGVTGQLVGTPASASALSLNPPAVGSAPAGHGKATRPGARP